MFAVRGREKRNARTTIQVRTTSAVTQWKTGYSYADGMVQRDRACDEYIWVSRSSIGRGGLVAHMHTHTRYYVVRGGREHVLV